MTPAPTALAILAAVFLAWLLVAVAASSVYAVLASVAGGLGG